MPTDASINADGFRFYEWPGGDSDLHRQYGATELTRVLSVTSIRRLCGESFMLVNWQLSNLTNAAMGQRQVETIGPRGGHKKGYAKDGEFPGAFVTRLLSTEGKDEDMGIVRKWLRDMANEPRDFAAVRGTIVHDMIEHGIRADQVDRAMIEHTVSTLTKRDRDKVAKGLRPEDYAFIGWAMANYWDMRVNVPFVVLAKEPQVWNLSAGYAGSADVLLWFLPEGTNAATRAEWQKLADQGNVFQKDIERVGGNVTLGDWKTSAGVYTDQVVQVHAYLAAEFIGSEGQIDERLTEIIRAAKKAALIHIRPDGWAVHFIDFEEHVLLAFLGSCAFARFLAAYPGPEPLFKHDLTGRFDGELAADIEE